MAEFPRHFIMFIGMKLQHVSFLLYGMTAAISNFSYRRRETEKFRLLSLLECIR